MKTKKTFNFLTFWKEIPRPDFLTTVHKTKSKGSLWGAWFLWNTVIALVITGISVFYIQEGLTTLETEIWPQVDEFNFVFEDQKLISTGLEEPYRIDIDDEGRGSALLIDLQGTSYDESSLEVFDLALLITEDRALVYESEDRKQQEILFSDFLEPNRSVSFSKQDLQNGFIAVKPTLLMSLGALIFMGLWFFFAVIRLIGMALLALIFMIIGMISRVSEKFTYGDYFLTTLGISFIPVIVGIGLLAAGLDPLRIGILIYGILIAMNIYEAPKKSKAKKS